MAVGADLRAMREAAGLSLNRMASKTHFTKSYLSMIETGKRSIVAEVVTAYEQALSKPLSPTQSDPVRLAHEVAGLCLSDARTDALRAKGR